MMRRMFAGLSLALLVLSVSVAFGQDNQTISQKGVIEGTMNIEFKTRTQLDETKKLAKTPKGDTPPALGVQDVYTYKLKLVGTTEYSGKITRQPRLVSSVLLREQQPALLKFDNKIAVLSKAGERLEIGNLIGTVPINPETGNYSFGGGGTTKLRIHVDSRGKVAGFDDNFGGILKGKPEKKQKLTSYTYSRVVGKKKITVVAKEVDPMRFDNIQLAKGPTPNYPKCTVNGSLDYDYATGNWLTEGIKFTYDLNGTKVEDVVTGSIKWVEDENRATNGKGYYDLNLRFNEEKNKVATTEAEAFDKVPEEDAFFVVDDATPCLTGKIEYEDQFIPGGDAEDPTPQSSTVTYAIDANKVTKQQVVNFFKLWLLCVGPTNDE